MKCAALGNGPSLAIIHLYILFLTYTYLSLKVDPFDMCV